MKHRPLTVILLIGVLTPLLSTLLFLFWQPAAQVNYGEILPPTPAARADWRAAAGGAAAFDGWRNRWILLTAAGGACDNDCRLRLCSMRQQRLLLSGHYFRLRRVWLITDDAPPPQTLPLASDCGAADNPALRARAREVDVLDGVQILRGAADSLPPPADEDYLYLLDPGGVWAMRFAGSLPPQHIHSDLKRLLKLSKGRRSIQQ